MRKPRRAHTPAQLAAGASWRVLGWIGRTLWGHRLELAGVGVAAAVAGAAMGLWRADRVWASMVVGTLGGVTALAVGRWVVARGLMRAQAMGRIAARKRARVRHQVRRALRHCGLGVELWTHLGNDAVRYPSVEAVALSPSGARVRLRLAPGQAWTDLASKAEALAAALRVRSALVKPEPCDRGRAWLVIRERDSLTETQGEPSPLLANEDEREVWRPVPVAVSEEGDEVTLSLVGQSLLVGGVPGSGKSAAVQQVVGAAALDPRTSIYLFDPKVVELAVWKRVAARVATDLDGANAALDELLGLMDERYELLHKTGMRKCDPRNRETPLVLAAFDELADWATNPDSESRRAFLAKLHRLLALGRAAAITAVLATQKPSAEVLPTSIRDLVGYRWAMRASTPEQSDTVLGRGWAAQGADASSVPASPEHAGVGFLLAEGGEPHRVRSYYLGDSELRALASRAELLRSQLTVGQ